MQTARAQNVNIDDRVVIHPGDTHELIGTVTDTDNWNGQILLTLNGHALVKCQPDEIVGIL